MIHEPEIRIRLFGSILEIIYQNKFFVQMNRRAFCGQSNQIKIPISLLRIHSVQLFDKQI